MSAATAATIIPPRPTAIISALGNARHEDTFVSRMSAAAGIPLWPVEITKFPNGESKVHIDRTIRGHYVFLVTTGVTGEINDNIMVSLLLLDALRRAGVEDIALVIPHFPYARMDRKNQPRVAISASMLMRLYENAGVKEIVTMDLHAAQIQGMTIRPVENLYALKYLIEGGVGPFMQELLAKDEHTSFVVLGPDYGSKDRMRAFCRLLAKYNGSSNDDDIHHGFLGKQRSRDCVVDKSTLVDCTLNDMKDTTVILVDDIFDSGSTMCKAAEYLRAEHGVKEVVCVVSHGVFAGNAFQNLTSCDAITTVFTTDSIPTAIGFHEKVRVVSVAPMFGEAIHRMVHNQSLSETLFP